MAGRLEGKVAIVTGAGQGIGEAIATAFHREGAAVMIAEANEKTGRAVAERLSLLGGRAAFHRTDVTRPQEVAAMVAATVSELGPIDILVNNAGINVFHEPLDTSEEEWRRCLAVDLEGVWTVCKAVLPHLIARQGGAIVNIASSHSFSIIPNTFPYPVAKHGLLGLTRALGIQYAAGNIRVNAIAPGYIETPIAVEYWNSFEDPAAERRRAYELHPPKRIGRPDEVAMTALFLASDEAPFINAACIVIDGGRSVLYHE